MGIATRPERAGGVGRKRGQRVVRRTAPRPHLRTAREHRIECRAHGPDRVLPNLAARRVENLLAPFYRGQPCAHLFLISMRSSPETAGAEALAEAAVSAKEPPPILTSYQLITRFPRRETHLPADMLTPAPRGSLMKDVPALRLAVTGAPRTGKTTVSTVLSLVTGLPHSAIEHNATVPRTDRKLAATVEVSVRGFERRLDSEARLTSGFISDGSILNEWAVAETRRRTRQTSWWDWLLRPRELPYRVFEQRFLAAHAGIVARRANLNYDAFVHLRIDPETETEEDLVERRTADRLLLDILHQSDLPCLVTGGTVDEIVTQVTSLCGLPQVISISDAVSAALPAA
ncbi:hypothetical protein [Nocardia sp. NPDC049149]|uniref:hypothetical protein n=1 Tax=Nocardia sp. NPDC049149 TaxID=3364315 RepID=UPI0037114CF8